MSGQEEATLSERLWFSVKWWLLKVEVVVTATEEEEEDEGESQ